jgi:4-hydroxy-tetrahydrodipicolinate reductase
MNSKKLKLGLIGATGRMGKLIIETINTNEKLDFYIHLGLASNKSILNINDKLQLAITNDFNELFKSSDIVVDFSHAHLIDQVLDANLIHQKPLIICTTGWEKTNSRQKKIDEMALKVPMLISTNTSLGSNLQSLICEMMSRILPDHYHVDLLEKHHAKKIDIPSGTACTLIESIINGKKEKNKTADFTYGQLDHGPRPSNFIAVSAYRSGNLPGEHEVSFTSEMELLSIKHIAYNRQLFALGVINIVEFLSQKSLKPQIYTMKDVLKSYF